jgi:hypothetical protein
MGAGLDGDDPAGRPDLNSEKRSDHALMRANVEDPCTGSESALPKLGDLRKRRPVAVVPFLRHRVGQKHFQTVSAV